VCLSGYFPLRDKIGQLRKETDTEGGSPDEASVPEQETGGKKWFYVHGTMDMLVPTKFYTQGKEELEKWVRKEDVEGHLYSGMGHSTSAAELRDLLAFFERVIPV